MSVGVRGCRCEIAWVRVWSCFDQHSGSMVFVVVRSGGRPWK